MVVVPKILAGENREFLTIVPGPNLLPYSLYAKFHMTIVLRNVAFYPLQPFPKADLIELDDFNNLDEIGKHNLWNKHGTFFTIPVLVIK